MENMESNPEITAMLSTESTDEGEDIAVQPFETIPLHGSPKELVEK